MFYGNMHMTLLLSRVKLIIIDPPEDRDYMILTAVRKFSIIGCNNRITSILVSSPLKFKLNIKVRGHK